MPLLWTSSKPKMEHQYQKNYPYLTEVQKDISDLPFVLKKGFSILSKSSKYLEVEFKALIYLKI